MVPWPLTSASLTIVILATFSAAGSVFFNFFQLLLTTTFPISKRKKDWWYRINSIRQVIQQMIVIYLHAQLFHSGYSACLSLMKIQQLYIFDRHCNKIYFQDALGLKKDNEDSKLVYGVVFSLRNILSKLVTQPSSEGYFAYTTDMYKLHFYQTPSALRFVLFTGVDVDSLQGQQMMIKLYSILSDINKGNKDLGQYDLLKLLN